MSTNRIVCRPNRTRSFISSDRNANCTSECERISEDAADENRDSLAFSSVFNGPQHKPILEASNEGQAMASSEADIPTSEHERNTNTNILHRRREPDEAEIMRTKIKYHFMNPHQKYRARGRKPWKLLIQIFKIIIVTTQVALFGFDRFDVVNFLEGNKDAFQHLFIKGYNSTLTSIYTKDEVYTYLQYAHSQYYQVKEEAIGTYDYKPGGSIPPVELCYTFFKKGEIYPSNNTYDVNPDMETECVWLHYNPDDKKNSMENVSFSFGSLLFLNLKFSLWSMNIKRLKSYDRPTCYKFDIEWKHKFFSRWFSQSAMESILLHLICEAAELMVHFDNARHDGRIAVDLRTKSTFLTRCKGYLKDSDNVTANYIKYLLVAFDFVVIGICFVSCILTIRSLIRSFWLAKDVSKFFKHSRQKELRLLELRVFFNMWFILIVISDLLTIIGSSYKLFIDQKDRDYYDVCSLLLGIAVLLVWSGLLRFLGYVKQYNILLLTLKAATPSVMRFMICTTVLFVGYLFCGWIVLGPYHRKFKTLTVAAECMYSLLNGDDMFATFLEMKNTKIAPYIFSKVYLYSFISLFIYVVLSLFIGIICDTYERFKDMGETEPVTSIFAFLNETRVGVESSDRRRNSNQQRPFWRSVSTLTGNSLMRRVSLDSTGAE